MNTYSRIFIQLDSMSYFWQLVLMNHARKARKLSRIEGQLNKKYL